MADPYGLELSGLPPELAAQARGLTREQAVAEAMAKQAMTPLGGARNAGMYMVAPSWTEGLAKIAQAYTAKTLGDKNDQKFADLSGRAAEFKRQRVADEMAKVTGLQIGSPEQTIAPATPNDDEGNAMPSAVRAAVAPNPQAAIAAALASQSPEVQRYAPILQAQYQRGEDAKVRNEQRTFEIKQRAQDRLDQIEAAAAAGRISRAEADARNAALRKDMQDALFANQRTMAGLVAGLRQPAAPTMTEIIDPTDPNRLLRVDAKSYKGGTLGALGVLGVSGKEPTAAKKEEQVGHGRETVNSLVLQLKDQYDLLSKNSGITDPSKGPIDNVMAGVASSGVGQTVGRMFGTNNQSARNTISQQRPLLLNAIKQATGMSAKQMDSNAELKLYLSAATDPQLDIKANLEALNMLDKLYGLGGIGNGQADAGKIKPPAAPQRRASDKATVLKFDAQGNPI